MTDIASIVPGDLAFMIHQVDDGSRQGRRLATALRRYRDAAHLGLGLEEALGFTEPGSAPWHAAETSRVRRGALLLQLSEHFTGSPTAKAKAMADAARHYDVALWSKRCELESPPSTDKPMRQLLWSLHRCASVGLAWPLSWRMIYNELQFAGLTPAKTSRQCPFDNSEE